MKLRSYQVDAVRSVRKALRNDLDHVHVLSLPTGAGKTRVALEIVLEFLRRNPGGRVLWLAHRWELLDHAWRKLKSLNPRLAQQSQRMGGEQSSLRSLRQGCASPIVFTTLQTWHARQRDRANATFSNGVPAIVVIDECHWAANASSGRALVDQFLGKARIFGLSATPKLVGHTYQIAYSKSFADLCPEFLAEPEVHEVETGFIWHPLFSGGEVTQRSLSELGSQEERNRKVIREYLRGLKIGHYRRTLIFACNIKHADRLNQLLSEKGVPSRTVHSRNSDRGNSKAIDDFRAGNVGVLVTVGKLTEGLDVPEIDSVFLGRPTASLTLLAQMIGRGARKTPNKAMFRIVEFTDNVQRLGEKFLHANAYVSAAIPKRRRNHRGAAEKHDEPIDVPRFERLYLPDLHGITFAQDQTFGVELEIGSRGIRPHFESAEWISTANSMIACLQEVAVLPVHKSPLYYHECDDPMKWRVCFDGSCGWEIVSPILVNAEGFAELYRVAARFLRLVEESPILQVNRETGMHITLATRLNTARRRDGFLARLTRLEPGLFTLVSPSRLYQCAGAYQYNRRRRNCYCAPICEAKVPEGFRSFSQAVRLAGRDRTVNLTKAGGPTRLLEVRMHQGTVDSRKIIPWIALWMHIFNHSRYQWNGEPRFGPVYPRGNTLISRAQANREDIFWQLSGERITLPSEFERVLRNRREELRPKWEQAIPKRVASWAEAGWYDVQSQC